MCNPARWSRRPSNTPASSKTCATATTSPELPLSRDRRQREKVRERCALVSIWAPPTAGQGAVCPIDDDVGTMFGHYSDDDPALVVSDTEFVDVLDEPPTVAAMVVAVVFGGDLVLLPAQIEHSDQLLAAKQG